MILKLVPVSFKISLLLFLTLLWNNYNEPRLAFLLACRIFNHHKQMYVTCWPWEYNNFPNSALSFLASDHFSQLLTYTHFVQHVSLTSLSGVSQITKAVSAVQVILPMSFFLTSFELSAPLYHIGVECGRAIAQIPPKRFPIFQIFSVSCML